MALVTVMAFQKWDLEHGQNVPSRVKGTAEAIADASGVPILGTEEQVDEELLDGNGFYDPARP